MDIEEVLGEFRLATSGSRFLDGLVAQWKGWRMTTLDRFDLSTSETRSQRVWLTSANEPVNVPHYSTKLQSAFNLACEIAPRQEAGFCWELNASRAQIGRMAPQFAPTPALALCLAAFECAKTLK